LCARRRDWRPVTNQMYLPTYKFNIPNCHPHDGERPKYIYLLTFIIKIYWNRDVRLLFKTSSVSFFFKFFVKSFITHCTNMINNKSFTIYVVCKNKEFFSINTVQWYNREGTLSAPQEFSYRGCLYNLGRLIQIQLSYYYYYYYCSIYYRNGENW